MLRRLVMDDTCEANRRVHIVQGEYHVTDDPNVIISTLLGSCVAACMRDPVACVGGMNHFLLPGSCGAGDNDTLRYGVHAMELLINGILRQGGRRERLEVMLFGGARMTSALADVGNMNSDFSVKFVRREGIRLTGESLRGDRARRIQFWPASGRIRQLKLSRGTSVPERAPPPNAVYGGSVELF